MSDSWTRVWNATQEIQRQIEELKWVIVEEGFRFRKPRHLESQSQTPSESSSSPDTGTPEETSDGWTTSYSLSSPVRADGFLPLSVAADIWAWCNSQLHPGNEQAVEIGVTLTSKAATPPSGSASSSPAEEVSQASGVAGEHDWRHFDMRNPERSY